MSKIREAFKVDKSEYTKIFDNEDYLLVIPHTHTASCKYGANTRWCTTKRDDDSDFEEHTTMGVLAYLIIKNPDIYENMSSKKYGLYRVDGYELKDLIVYDELNNEHTNGKYYLSNEFEKAERERDFWTIINKYDEYYMSNSVEGLLGNKPGKINETITIDMIKDMCNRMVITKKGGIGRLTQKSVVYYTKGGKIVDIESIQGSMSVPFKLGDNMNDLMKWVEENEIDTDNHKRRRRIGESEGESNLKDKYSLYDICFLLVTGRFNEEDEESIINIHGDEYLSSITPTKNRGGELLYRFNSYDEFLEVFNDGREDYALNWGSTPDYDYYSDSVYNDVTEESYHMIQLRKHEMIKICDKLLSIGINVKSYTPEVKEKLLNSDNGWGNDDVAIELHGILERYFPSYNEKFSDVYQDTAVSSYAEGFSNAIQKAKEEWLENGNRLIGLEEYNEFEEYGIDAVKLFSFLIRPSTNTKSGNLSSLIESNKVLNGSIGSGSDIFGFDEARYEYEESSHWERLRQKYTSIVEEFLTDLDTEYIDEIEEFKHDTVLLKKYGIEYSDEVNGIVSNSWNSQNRIDSLKNSNNRSYFESPSGTSFLYAGYDFEEGAHIVYENIENDEMYYGNRLKKHYLSVERIIQIKTQSELELNESWDLSIIKEQSNEIMNTYYAMMGELVKYYGEDNVNLIGDPAKIVIGDYIFTWDGVDLFMTYGGVKSRIKVTDYDSNRSGTTYPSISYITNRVKKGQTKTTTEKPKTPIQTNKSFLDGTTLKASQNFWDMVKVEEGSPSVKGSPVLSAYALGDGRITIGWGHTGALTQPRPKLGDKITQGIAQQYLQNDATEAANCVRRMLGEWKEKGLKTYKVTQNMFDVLVSLAFNAGCDGLRTSKFIQYVKKGQYTKAAQILPTDTTMISGKFSDGLTKRRKREAELFIRGI